MPSPSNEDEERERYRELLEELRTIIPGVQVLFGFLLAVPFTPRFADLDGIGLRVFVVALMSVGLATVVFLTPAAYHRIAPRHERRERLRLGIRSTVAGMVLLTISVSAAVFVVTRLIFQTDSLAELSSSSATVLAAISAAVVGGSAVVLWFALPILYRQRRR